MARHPKRQRRAQVRKSRAPKAPKILRRPTVAHIARCAKKGRAPSALYASTRSYDDAGFSQPESRSFDEARNAVRFIGYDGMFEVPFFVEAAALATQGGSRDGHLPSEAEYLAAFDSARGSIQDVAREAYSNSRRSSYKLTAADFR